MNDAENEFVTRSGFNIVVGLIPSNSNVPTLTQERRESTRYKERLAQNK